MIENHLRNIRAVLEILKFVLNKEDYVIIYYFILIDIQLA